MQLNIFAAVGLYFGGVVGIIAETPEEAAEIGNHLGAENEKANTQMQEIHCLPEKEGFNGAKFIVLPAPVGELPGAPMIEGAYSVDAMKCLAIIEGEKRDGRAYWVYTRSIPVFGYQKGVLFSEYHTG